MNRPQPRSRRAYQPAPLTADELSALIVDGCRNWMIVLGIGLCIVSYIG